MPFDAAHILARAVVHRLALLRQVPVGAGTVPDEFER